MILGKEPMPFETGGVNDGLAFSMQLTAPIRSLRDVSFYHQNIFLELWDDQRIDRFHTTSFKKWAKQGVLCWNYLPTVKEKFPLAHNQWGWNHLSDEIIETVFLTNPHCVFMIWGSLNFNIHEILPSEALVIETASPFTMQPENGWFGSHPFSRCNQILKSVGEREINWSL